MSTRAAIIIRDESDTLFFYRHSDGYPECTGADLADFIKGYNTTMRTNVPQSAGWLIVRGHAEYLKGAVLNENLTRTDVPFTGSPIKLNTEMGWKVGAYEPATCMHGDVEFVYIIDLKARTLSCRVPTDGFWDKPSLESTKESRKFKAVRF